MWEHFVETYLWSRKPFRLFPLPWKNITECQQLSYHTLATRVECVVHTQELKWLKDDAVSFHSVFNNVLWKRLLPPTFSYFYAVSTQRSLCYNSQYQMLVLVASVTFSELHDQTSICVYVKRSKHVTCLISIWSIRGGSHMRGCIVTQLGCDWSKFF